VRAITSSSTDALAKVDCVIGESVKPKESSFVIEGDFEPKAAFQALHKAGFHASLPEKKSALAPLGVTLIQSR
jgi:periplasmic mercuric ion binding protein